MVYKVHIFWEGANIQQNYLPADFPFTLSKKNQLGDNVQFLWPSQNTWTLKAFLIFIEAWQGWYVIISWTWELDFNLPCPFHLICFILCFPSLRRKHLQCICMQEDICTCLYIGRTYKLSFNLYFASLHKFALIPTCLQMEMRSEVRWVGKWIIH